MKCSILCKIKKNCMHGITGRATIFDQKCKTTNYYCNTWTLFAIAYYFLKGSVFHRTCSFTCYFFIKNLKKKYTVYSICNTVCSKQACYSKQPGERVTALYHLSWWWTKKGIPLDVCVCALWVCGQTNDSAVSRMACWTIEQVCVCVCERGVWCQRCRWYNAGNPVKCKSKIPFGKWDATPQIS